MPRVADRTSGQRVQFDDVADEVEQLLGFVLRGLGAA